MSDPSDLVAGFAKRYPAMAAGVLETQAIDAAAAALSELESPVAATVLGSMLPRYAAERIDAMEPVQAGAILAALPPGFAAMILRQLAEAHVPALLDAMPERSAIPVRLILRYPPSMIGAWMEVGAMVLPLEDYVADALRRTRESTGELDRLIFVVDREQHLQGAVRSATLLRSPEDTPLSELLLDVPFVLRARSDLRSAQDHPGWTSFDPLPVVNRDRRFVGVLHNADLRRGADDALNYQAPAVAVADSLIEWLDLSWQALDAVLEGSLKLMPSKNTTAPPRNKTDV